MAVTSLSEWSTTAGSNTELNGISLAENVMRPPAVNNAFREMMAQLAAYSRRGADLATAATLNLDSVDTDFLDLTGTTTVTAVTLTDTHSRRARAVGVFQLTASANLIVNGSASTPYTTTAGDLLFFEGYGASVVRVWTVAGGAGTTFATNAQAVTGTSTVLAVNPANLAFVTDGYATTATAAGTTTLTVTSEPQQFFTGTTTQTVALPVTSTLNLGRRFRIVNNSTGAVTVNSSGGNLVATVGAGQTSVVTCILTSGTTAASWNAVTTSASGITLGTAVATTSGTTVDWIGIPATAKRVTVNFAGVSTTGTSPWIVQIGDSGGIETSGYLGTSVSQETGSSETLFTNGFGINFVNAGAIVHGSLIMSLLNPATNLWSVMTIVSGSNSARGVSGSFSKALSAVLDRVRLTTSGGTDTFDAGLANISYE